MYLVVLGVLFIVACIGLFIHNTFEVQREMEALEAEYQRDQPTPPWWEEHKFNTRDKVEESPTTVSRAPADPIDAINPLAPTQPTLRQEYQNMIKLRELRG